MLKDYFQRNIDLMNQLRSQHFKYTQYINKGKYKMKQKFFGKGKKHYDFDINSQEYFHQEINDIVFQSSECQEEFYNMFTNMINNSMINNNIKNNSNNNNSNMIKNNSNNLNNPTKSINSETSYKYIPQQQRKKQNNHLNLNILNPSQCRLLLSKHFYTRTFNLRYKKYLILCRYYNLPYPQNQLLYVQSRTNLLDKQIQSCISRQIRLSQQDYFQQSFICGGKPIPISQTGQPIYKYLDEEQCWYSNISRDDIIVYTRNVQFKRELLNQCYYCYEMKINGIVMKDGVEVMMEIEDQFEKYRQMLNKDAAKKAEEFNLLIQKQLEKISPGNLVQKQNLNNFGYTIFGILSNRPLNLPLYPCIYPQLLQLFTSTCSLFFNNISFSSHQSIISLLPKLNSFSQIIFKYQNKQILQGEKQIKLGLQDDIDIKKQLFTMLEQLWVRKHVKISFQRYDYKLQLKDVDWEMDTITSQNRRVNQRKRDNLNNSNNKIYMDNSIQELIKIINYTDFYMYRKHMKKRAEKIVQRAKYKYIDMQNINNYNSKSSQKMTLQQLSQLFKIKFDQSQFRQQSILKGQSQNFLNQILKKHYIVNPAQIQIIQTIKCLKIRQNRTKLMNVLNGMRCYHRNLCFDMKVILGQQFKFKLDDEFLINSNKQVVENFQKAVKQTATLFTKNSNNNNQHQSHKLNEQYYLSNTYKQSSMLYKKDIIQLYYFNQQIPHILVSNGKRRKSKILYGIVLENDLKLVQERILQYGTYVVNQYERYVKVKNKEEIVDRVELMNRFYQLQLQYQYEKFKLIEKYYYIYENITNLLEAFKISKLITQLIYKTPQFDSQKLINHTFSQIYEFQIQSFKSQLSSLQIFINKLKYHQQNKVIQFHKRYSQLLKIPLSAQVYLYRDIELKQKSNKNRLQRMNSINSKISSRSSKNNQHNNKNNIMNNNNNINNNNNEIMKNVQIKEQFDQDNSSIYDEENSFDIQNYDQYLLRKDMDAIFDDMVQNDDNKETMQVNTAALENVVVNPKFQGGPHPYNNKVAEISITSENKVQFLNFYQSLSFAANLHQIIQNLQQQFIHRYGYVSKSYQACFLKVICKFIDKLLLQQLKYQKPWKQFQSCDSYNQIVTTSSRFYQQIMSPCLDPPSNIQMAIASTLQRHQQKLPSFNIISCLDYHSIQSLITLKKPLNSASYRQLALGINYLTFLNIRQYVYMIHLERNSLVEAYEKLGVEGGSKVEKYGHMYSRSGQSDVFMAIQQIKLYKDEMYKYPVLPEIIQDLKILVSCQKADIQLFRTVIKSSKIKLQDLIIMKHQIGRQFQNSRFDNSRLLSLDQKNIKMIKNRISSQISRICNQQFKCNSFMKVKQQLKLHVQKTVKIILESDLKHLIIFPKQKISQFSKGLLQDKLKRKLKLQLIECYWKDMVDTNVKVRMLVESDKVVNRLRWLISCAPYLRKIFQFAPEYQVFQKNVLYDQKKVQKIQKQHNIIGPDGNVIFPKYIYSRSQLIQQWQQQQTIFRINNLKQFKVHQLPQLHPPKQKDLLFKWLYKIPDFHFSPHQSTSFQLFLNFTSVFTGKCGQIQYLPTSYIPQLPRNKFYSMYNYYMILLQYLQTNYLLISLQMENDVLDSFRFILDNYVDFEETYKLKDQISVNESLQGLQEKYLKNCYNYKETREQDKEKIRKKLEQKKYQKSKEHWKVYDEILDFIVAKVEGRGVMRENFLPLSKQLETIINSTQSIQTLLKKKTEQTQCFFVLSTLQAYLNQQQTNQIESVKQKQNNSNIIDKKMFYHYLFPIFKWFFGNGLQNYNLQNQKNVRFNLKKLVNLDEKQSLRFITGVFIGQNTVNNQSVIQRYKAVCSLLAPDVNGFLKEVLTNKQNKQNQSQIVKKQTQNMLNVYNFSFLSDGIKLFDQIGQDNRLKIFARMRYFYEKSTQFMKIKNQSSVKGIQGQQAKLSYLKFLLNSKIQSLSVVVFTQKVQFPISSKTFKSANTQIRQTVQINTYNIFQKFQQYKAQNKIQLSKSEMKLISSSQHAKKDHNLRIIFNNILRQVIFAKLMREQFKSKALLSAINILRRQKLQTIQAKKIVNTSLIPRVHLIGSYSSPLILDRKTYISQQYKLAFAQAFINRFRNKVSRVDLLSSGYGFVITVPDLQDCVNFMNKLLFTFSQKQFKYRQQTHFQYFDIMVDGINQKNKTIKQQQQVIKYLQQKLNNIMQAEYLGKVSKLLHEKTLIQDKLRVVEQSTNGIEDRIRKAVEVQYEKQMKSLTDENQLLKNKFNQFKELFVILTKDTAKNNFLNVANTIRQKIGELLNKRIDVSGSFVTSQSQNQKKIVKQEQNNHHYKQNDKPLYKQDTNYVTEDLQRCKLGQDIIHDPYYVTKLITKMRFFNIFKLGCKKINFDDTERIKTKQLKQLHKIQDSVIAQSERQIFVREQFKKTQQQLSKKVAELQKIKQNYQHVENQRTKLKILLTSKQKKLQQKQKQAMQMLKKMQQFQKLPTLTNIQSKTQKLDQIPPKVSDFRKAHKTKVRQVDKSAFLTNYMTSPQPSVISYDRFQLSNKDVTWRQKCQQLYMQNKKLLGQLQKLQIHNSVLSSSNREAHSLSTRQRKRSQSVNVGSQTMPVRREDAHRRFPNLSFKYNLMKQTQEKYHQ